MFKILLISLFPMFVEEIPLAKAESVLPSILVEFLYTWGENIISCNYSSNEDRWSLRRGNFKTIIFYKKKRGEKGKVIFEGGDLFPTCEISEEAVLGNIYFFKALLDKAC